MEPQGGFHVLVLAALLLAFLAVWARWGGSLPMATEESDPEAEERAAALQRDLLTERERGQLADSGYLAVPSPGIPGRTYRVPARPGWVDVYESGSLSMRVCVEPVVRLPAADVVLMHKLMIEGNEEGYLRQANIVYMRRSAASVVRRFRL